MAEFDYRIDESRDHGDLEKAVDLLKRLYNLKRYTGFVKETGIGSTGDSVLRDLGRHGDLREGCPHNRVRGSGVLSGFHLAAGTAADAG
jgi:hypothetical protein